MALTIEMLAAEPRWDARRLHSLPGRSRGDLLGAWGNNVVARFGDDALARVRRRLAPPLDEIPSALTTRDWLPVYAQLALTEAIVDELLGGDMRALYPLLVEDTRAGMGRVHLALLRGLGAERALRLASRQFRKVHERGRVEVEINGRCARLTFRGTPLFANPTWRLLQVFATCTMLELVGTPGVVEGEHAGDDGFVTDARW